MKHTEKMIGESLFYTGRVFSVVKKESVLENEMQVTRDIVVHPGAAAVLAADSDKNVYMIRQFRAPFEQEVLEIPAGKLEKGEDPFRAAKRELEEETGLSAENYISLGQIWPTVGYCNEIIHLYLATGLSRGQMHPDEDEFVSVEKIPFDSLYQMCVDGSIKDGKTIAAVMRAARHIK